MSEANQLFITSKKKDTKEYGDGNWGYFSFDETFKAWKELKPASFALYMFLLRDQPNFNRTLYKVEFEKLTGYKKTAYYSALQELKDKGYLIHTNGTHWNFYPERFSANADRK